MFSLVMLRSTLQLVLSSSIVISPPLPFRILGFSFVDASISLTLHLV